MVKAADWWSEMLDGTEWPDRQSGCPTWDPFAGKVTALADELLIWARVDATAGTVAGYASGCFFPTVAGGVPALDPGGGSVVVGADFVTSEVLLRHEIGHLLGLVSWPPETGLKTADGAYFTGARAVEAFRAGGGDPSLPGVPMADSHHWHGETVVHELMVPQGGPVNSVSLSALVDAGYTVDLSKAVPWPWRPPGDAQAVRAELLADGVLGVPRVFLERRPRAPRR